MVCQRMWLQPHFPRDERREVQACRIDNETINFLPILGMLTVRMGVSSLSVSSQISPTPVRQRKEERRVGIRIRDIHVLPRMCGRLLPGLPLHVPISDRVSVEYTSIKLRLRRQKSWSHYAPSPLFPTAMACWKSIPAVKCAKSV